MGWADAELRVPNTPDLIYRIGSLTKPFTATAVMSLRDRGLLSLEDSVCRYVAHCPAGWSSVTIRTMLNHTSGIPDLFGELAAVPVVETRSEVDRVLERSGNLELRSQPGVRYAYSNFNYILLGYVIEVATGESYEAVLRRTVFESAQLRDTAYDDVWAIVPRRAVGYIDKNGQLRNTNYHDHAAFAAGGLHSTVDDLSRWGHAFFTGRLVAPATVKEMVTPGQGDYGLGWQTLTRFGRLMHNHSGGVTGFASHVAYYPQDDLLIVLLSNVEDDPVKNTAFDLAAIVFGVTPTTPGSTEQR